VALTTIAPVRALQVDGAGGRERPVDGCE
jgi:hypothetical protein